MEEIFYGLVRWSKGSYRNREGGEEKEELEEETENRKEMGRLMRMKATER